MGEGEAGAAVASDADHVGAVPTAVKLSLMTHGADIHSPLLHVVPYNRACKNCAQSCCVTQTE